MADPPHYPDTGDDTEAGFDGDSTTGTPRWVKVFGVIALVVILLFAVSLLAGGGSHGPGRHTPSDGVGDQTPRSASPSPPAQLATHRLRVAT